MKKTAFFTSAAAAAVLAACSGLNNPFHTAPSRAVIPQTQPPLPQAAAPFPQSAYPAAAATAPRARQNPESEAKVLSDYRQYTAAADALKNNNPAPAAAFLQQTPDSAMSENLRRQLLNRLGGNGQWQEFARHYGYLKPDSRDRENRCYAVLGRIETNYAANEALEELGRLPEGCNRLLETLASQNRLPQDRVWRRVRGLLAADRISDARRLAAAAGSPLPEPLSAGNTASIGGREALLYSVIGPNQSREAGAAARLQNLSGSLNAAQTGFGWAVIGYRKALSQDFSEALAAFRKADRSQLGKEHWEWYARSALRLGQWAELTGIIRAMPPALQADPAWQYWLGRSLAATGHQAQAAAHYQTAAASGRNFYALLAAEALGSRVDTRNNTPPPDPQTVQYLAGDGAIARALTLFRASRQNSDWNMRRQAQAEWRYAVSDLDEPTLLAAAKLAHDHGFYEMGIYAADRTDRLLDYQLRYITPFRDAVTRHAAAARVDTAWAYGLIRQESRFMVGVRSHAGATGLMQVMPATAREIAGKIGMNPAELHTIEGNIRMGTWYLGNARNNLGHEVLATAGYNAGPGRAKRWQAAVPLEGAVYAETIPIDETRDYVKRVMANTIYYASLLGHPQPSLAQRMGTVPARR